MVAISASAEVPADIGRLANNGILVLMLQTALSRAETNTRTIPCLVADIIADDAWREFLFPEAPDQVIRWNAADFRAFIESPRPRGCQTPLHVARRMVHDTAAEEKFEELIRGERGAQQGEVRNPSGNNQHIEIRFNRNHVTDNPDSDEPATLPIPPPRPRVRDYARESKQGNSVSYALRRLGSERPDLLERVRAREMTAHAAMVAAGFRARMIQVPAEPQAAARILRKNLTPEQVAELARLLITEDVTEA